jgi:hypothetical protein
MFLKNLMKALLATVVVCVSAVAMAQAPITVVVPAGVQQNPAGFYNLNTDVWFGDRINGVVHYAPDDPTLADPLTAGTYHVDLTQGFTIEGIAGSQFASFNYIGQVARVSDTLALLAVPDSGKGSNGKPVGGIWALSFDSNAQSGISPVGNLTQLVPDKGLNGPQPTSVALGPDGKVYFANLKNGNLQRINGANVEAVGGVGGQAILSQAFNGSDDYLGAADGFYVLPNAPACIGNQNNCGKPTLIAGGATVAVASDGLGNVYFAQALGTVSRFTTATGTIVPVASGLSFGNVTAGLGFDRDGNLWIGQNSEIDRILAADLASIQ